MAIYVDTSALLKLVFEERESPALEAFISGRAKPITSTLTRLEVARALLRAHSVRRRCEDAENMLKRVIMVAMDDQLLRAAATVRPAELRSLDAVHLATALSTPNLEGMVVYDLRLARAAEAAGLRVWAPGQMPES